MMECEALIPLSLASEASVIMAGDDKQMGPRVESSSSEHHGLVSKTETYLRENVWMYRGRNTLRERVLVCIWQQIYSFFLILKYYVARFGDMPI